MVKGALVNNGSSWFVLNKKRGGFWETFGVSKFKPVVAWKCDNCQKIELRGEKEV